ncbi:MAG: VanZ family protein [Firmicutes bacterium]|nr:VanZ family protein [Bacillota bacterium]
MILRLLVSAMNYMRDMLPFMLSAAPFYVVVRSLYVKRKRMPLRLPRELVMFAFAMYCAGLASATVLPTEGVRFSLELLQPYPFHTILKTFRELARGRYALFTDNFVGNIVVFMPLGVFIPALWKLSFAKTVLCGFFSSLFIEISQLFIHRHSDIDDLILNTFGAAAGYALWKLFSFIGEKNKK